MNQSFKDRIKRTFIYPIWMDVSFRNWEKKGRPIPPPHAVKAKNVREYARQFSIDILSELKHIFSHPIKDHVILMDDAREFTGKNDYPLIEYLRKFVSKERPNWVFEIKYDIIRIHE